MTELSIDFEEKTFIFGSGSNWNTFREFSPNGMVPCLKDKERDIWDSLAIAEYLAEEHKTIWPSEKNARTWARCAAAEMHSGFFALRQTCPMNCAVRVKLNEISNDLQKDLNRIDELWNQGLSEFQGPFLAGKNFSAVDAFFAPVVFRIQTFNLPMSTQALAYCEHLLTLNSMQKWQSEAIKEPWIETDHEKETISAGTLIKDYRA
ncbi:glutathione S-transferase [Aliikangiella sp. IMCC44359]|uniref:glutathione S-transferase n=1 Tax=Aliikangiella sp. IMCC44359 TaxID=3459125 RepID=UPI00403AE0AD